MSILIRPANESDAAAICGVVRSSISLRCQQDHHDDPVLLASWLANKTVETSLRWLKSSASVAFVAELDGEVCGFALAQHDELMLCYASEQTHGQGVGRAMLQAIEEALRAQGVKVLKLESTMTAQDFYRRNGFSECGPVEVAFGMAAIPMQKTL